MYIVQFRAVEYVSIVPILIFSESITFFSVHSSFIQIRNKYIFIVVEECRGLRAEAKFPYFVSLKVAQRWIDCPRFKVLRCQV